METRSAPLVGVMWMVVTGLCFVAVTAIVKHVGQGLPAIEAAFLRYAIGLVFILPLIRPMLAAPLRGPAGRLLVVRGLFQTAGSALWFFAMTRIPIAEVTAMNYLAPVYVTLGAALFLGERLAARRLIAIAAALLGALLILRPGVREVSAGHIAMLVSAPAFAASYLIAKRLTGLLTPSVIVGWLSVATAIGLAPLALAVWEPPTPVELAWLALTAAFATVAHYTMMLAFRAAPVAVTQPVTFLQLVWAAALGALVFAEPVDPWVVLGGSVIVAAVCFIAWREARARRLSATVGPVEATRL